MRCAHCREFSGDAAEIKEHQAGCAVAGWRDVVLARERGEIASAERMTRKLLGVVEPMTEEAKEKLRKYREEHKEEIAERARLKRRIRRAERAIMKPRRRMKSN